MKPFIVFFLLLFLTSSMVSQSTHKLLRIGDRAYQDEQYSLAEESYRKALEKKKSLKSAFNLGNTVYQQDRFEEAVQQYDAVAQGSSADQEKANALYNLGNAHLKSGQSDAAIDAYKNALRHNQQDPDFLKNLYIAKMMQQQERQQQQQQEENQQQQEQEENQSESQQQDQNQASNQDPSQNAEIGSEGEQNEDAPQNQELSKEDALKLLQVIENEEKNVQEKLRKSSGKRKKMKKDW